MCQTEGAKTPHMSNVMRKHLSICAQESAGRDQSCGSAEGRAQDSVRSLQVSNLLGKLRSAVQSIDERLACTVVGSSVTRSTALGPF